MLLAEELDRLETALAGNKAIKLVVRYAIRDSESQNSKDGEDASQSEENAEE